MNAQQNAEIEKNYTTGRVEELSSSTGVASFSASETDTVYPRSVSKPAPASAASAQPDHISKPKSQQRTRSRLKKDSIEDALSQHWSSASSSTTSTPGLQESTKDYKLAAIRDSPSHDLTTVLKVTPQTCAQLGETEVPASVSLSAVQIAHSRATISRAASRSPSQPSRVTKLPSRKETQSNRAKKQAAAERLRKSLSPGAPAKSTGCQEQMTENPDVATTEDITQLSGSLPKPTQRRSGRIRVSTSRLSPSPASPTKVAKFVNPSRRSKTKNLSNMASELAATSSSTSLIPPSQQVNQLPSPTQPDLATVEEGVVPAPRRSNRARPPVSRFSPSATSPQRIAKPSSPPYLDKKKLAVAVIRSSQRSDKPDAVLVATASAEQPLEGRRTRTSGANREPALPRPEPHLARGGTASKDETVSKQSNRSATNKSKSNAALHSSGTAVKTLLAKTQLEEELVSLLPMSPHLSSPAGRTRAQQKALKAETMTMAADAPKEVGNEKAAKSSRKQRRRLRRRSTKGRGNS